MKYSNITLTDDNFDSELELLCTLVGVSFDKYESFVKALPNKFTKQTHKNGFEEWVHGETVPNKGSDFRQAYQVGQLAYEYENGFIILNFETLL